MQSGNNVQVDVCNITYYDETNECFVKFILINKTENRGNHQYTPPTVTSQKAPSLMNELIKLDY